MTDVVQSDGGVPNGLIVLIGPPASGKSSFTRAWIERGQLDPDGHISCDAIRNELFGDRVDVVDDPAVFDEMDRRVAARLEAALAVVVDATNVMPHARARMIAWARQHGRPVTALRFRVAAETLVQRNSQRLGHARVPLDEVLRSAAAAARHTDRVQLADEGISVVVDVPGEADGLSSAQAAAMIRITA
ncbi:ATP-binding protein [Dactylosporangium sp. NPDC051485]|uniref:ATP-binding protein n=1 Tax=Dactylosporangium sp. NPDC051485 TaxID=3154846 RepID=UPI0034399274